MSRSVDWPGVVGAGQMLPEAAATRRMFIRMADAGDWAGVTDMLRADADLVHAISPEDGERSTVLHLAARNAADLDVIAAILRAGAWRSLRDARGRRPVDIARTRRIETLLAALQPALRHDVPRAHSRALERGFRAVILGRLKEGRLSPNGLRLPQIEPMLETKANFWFAVPGMYGGFHYWLKGAKAAPILVSESWCRVVGGSGQRHEITADGSRLVDEGFV